MDAAEVPDEYRPIAPLLPLVDRALEFAMRGIRRDVVRILKSRGTRDVLDLGCGAGPLSRMLADAGISSVCLEPSPTMLSMAGRRARRRPRFRVLAGSAECLPFGAEFDAVVFSLVLHELDPSVRERGWEEANRVLRPGGAVVAVDFALPPGRGLRARWGAAAIRFIERQAGRMHPPHYRNYLRLMAEGGMAAWLQARDAHVLEERRYASGNIGLFVVHGRNADPAAEPA